MSRYSNRSDSKYFSKHDSKSHSSSSSSSSDRAYDTIEISVTVGEYQRFRKLPNIVISDYLYLIHKIVQDSLSGKPQLPYFTNIAPLFLSQLPADIANRIWDADTSIFVPFVDAAVPLKEEEVFHKPRSINFTQFSDGDFKTKIPELDRLVNDFVFAQGNLCPRGTFKHHITFVFMCWYFGKLMNKTGMSFQQLLSKTCHKWQNTFARDLCPEFLNMVSDSHENSLEGEIITQVLNKFGSCRFNIDRHVKVVQAYKGVYHQFKCALRKTPETYKIINLSTDYFSLAEPLMRIKIPDPYSLEALKISRASPPGDYNFDFYLPRSYSKSRFSNYVLPSTVENEQFDELSPYDCHAAYKLIRAQVKREKLTMQASEDEYFLEKLKIIYGFFLYTNPFKLVDRLKIMLYEHLQRICKSKATMRSFNKKQYNDILDEVDGWLYNYNSVSKINESYKRPAEEIDDFKDYEPLAKVPKREGKDDFGKLVNLFYYSIEEIKNKGYGCRQNTWIDMKSSKFSACTKCGHMDCVYDFDCSKGCASCNEQKNRSNSQNNSFIMDNKFEVDWNASSSRSFGSARPRSSSYERSFGSTQVRDQKKEEQSETSSSDSSSESGTDSDFDSEVEVSDMVKKENVENIENIKKMKVAEEGPSVTGYKNNRVEKFLESIQHLLEDSNKLDDRSGNDYIPHQLPANNQLRDEKNSTSIPIPIIEQEKKPSQVPISKSSIKPIESNEGTNVLYKEEEESEDEVADLNDEISREALRAIRSSRLLGMMDLSLGPNLK